MIFDQTLKKGVRKRSLPEPNPQKISLPRSSTIKAVLLKAKELYFEEYDIDEDLETALLLCDSAGIVIPVKDDTWSLGGFYQKNGLQPSRYKLYVALNLVRYLDSCKIFIRHHCLSYIALE